ncbi:MAG: hypothetical protein QM820_43035 [Minicystis sp.]
MANPATLAEGCRKLEESFKLAVRGDTMLNLALCHEKLGKTATAWVEYERAIAEGERVKFTDAVEVAKKRRDELGEKLSMLTVDVPVKLAALAGLTIEVNGAPWPEEKRNKPIPFDPGPLEITATAPGYKPFAARVDLGAEKDRKTVTVALEPQPPPPAPPPPASKPRPVWPWIVGGVGLALGGAAIGFAVDQRAAASQLNDKCGPMRGCPVGFDYHPLRSREVRDYGLLIGLSTAGALAVGGAGIGLALGSRQRPTLSARVVFSPTSITLEGEIR